MEEYGTDPQHRENGLVGDLDDMDMMHDFGEGVGVDMRDFNVHPAEDSKDAIDPELGLPPDAGPSTGGSMPPSIAGANVDDMFQTETGLDEEEDDDDDSADMPTGSKRARGGQLPGGFEYVDKDGEPGRRKIRIEYIADKARRHITFSKRKAGIMKKAYELSILTGTQVLLLVVSETGLVYTFTTSKLQPLVQKAEGKNLIQACLNAPDGYGPDGQPLTGPVSATKAKNGGLAIRPHKLSAAASAAMAASAQASAHATSGGGQTDHPSDPASIGHGTPSSARPKKRLPSGKAKKQPTPQPPADVPPVPSIPDIHRQPSPHQANAAGGAGAAQPPPGMMVSPMSAGYHLSPDYQQHQQPGFYPPGGQEGYGAYYGGMGHPQYMMPPAHGPGGQPVYGATGESGRRDGRGIIMEQRPGMGMPM